MARVALLPVLLLALAAVASGCAQGGSGSGPAAALRAWPTSAPALPPPDPSAYASAHPQASTRPATPAAQAPSAAPEGAPSDAEVARELRRALGASGSASTRALVDAASVRADGLATVPPGAPARVADIIQGGNEVARKPYVYGGGHGRLAGETWIDTAYDCSGSVSFALATAGLVEQPMDSTRSPAGAARPRALGDDLRERRPRLHDGRRPALRHLRPPGHGDALADRAAHGVRVHGPPPTRPVRTSAATATTPAATRAQPCTDAQSTRAGTSVGW